MNDAWIQARGFDEIVPVIILVLWGIGKFMTSRAAAKERNRPPPGAAPPPVPGSGEIPAMRTRAREEQLRRFLAELAGGEVPPAESQPPQIVEPPGPRLAPMPQSFPLRSESDRGPRVNSIVQLRSEARRKRRQRMPSPPVSANPYPVSPPVPGPVDREQDSAPMSPAKISVFHSTAMRDFNVAGPRGGAIMRTTRAGSSHATWYVRPLLSDVRRLREAVILRTVLSPPRALDPL